jgi:hypothetical protein
LKLSAVIHPDDRREESAAWLEGERKRTIESREKKRISERSDTLIQRSKGQKETKGF